MVLSPHPMPGWVSGKMAAHWVSTGLPLTLLSPLLGLQYGLSVDTLGVLAFALLLGTPVLSLLGAACTALALGARGGGVLLALLALPLFVPVLIFGAGAAEAQSAGVSAMPHLSLLGAGLILAVMAVPFAVCAAIRIATD
jgi:heme exporter protein B